MKKSSGASPTSSTPVRYLKALWIAVLWTLSGSAAAGVAPSVPTLSASSDSWTLYRSLVAADTLQVDAPNGLWSAELEPLARELESFGRWDVVREPRADAPRIVFGVLGDARIQTLIDALSNAASGSALPIEVTVEGFVARGERYQHERDAFALTWEDPERPGLPLTLVAAGGARALQGIVRDLTPPWRPGLTTYRRGELHRREALSGRAAGLLPFRPGAARLEYERTARVAEGAGYRARCLGPQPSDGAVDLGDYGTAVEQARRAVLAWIAKGDPESRAPAARLVVYSDSRTWIDVHGELALARVDSLTLHAHVLLEPSLVHDGGAAAAQSVALGALGPARVVWLAEAAGVEAADTWWGRSLDEWVAFLAESGSTLELTELLAPGAVQRHSPHVVRPLRAYLVRHLRTERGAGACVALWRGELDPAGDVELAGSFAAALAANLERFAESLAALRSERHAQALAPFRNGVALRPGVAGYAGRALATSLERAAAIGADDVALRVFASASGNERTYVTDGPVEFPAADRSDVELMRAARLAGALGQRTLLQPHLLASPSGGLSGALHLGTEDHVFGFFDDLEALAVHYALVAELAGCDVLSLGAGLANATITGGGDDELSAELGAELERDPEDDALRAMRSDGWRRVIGRVRAVFTGGLTYAAQRGGPGWGGEGRQFGLWSELDFVGIDLFAPLSHPDRSAIPPRQRELEHRFERAVEWVGELAERFDRPALLTSVGVPATARGWRSPWSDAGEFDPALQAEMLDVIAASIPTLRRSLPRWRGFFLWDWSADGAQGGARSIAATGNEAGLRAALRH